MLLIRVIDILGFKDIDKQSDNLKEQLIAKLKSLCVDGKSVSCDVYSLSAEEIKALIDLLEKEQMLQIRMFFIEKYIDFVKELSVLRDKGLRVSHLDI